MYNKAEIFTDTGKVTVADKEYDENYSITRSINYVKNSGIAFVEAIYDVVSESVEELELNLGVYDKDGKVLSEDKLIIIPSSDGARASLKLDVRNYTGEVTVKSSLVKKVDKMAVLAECERRINLTGSFADPKNITVSSNSKFYKRVLLLPWPDPEEDHAQSAG